MPARRPISDILRMARLGVVPVPQWQFLGAFGDMYQKAIGVRRTERMYRARSYLDAGIVLPGSSDCPVVSGAPLAGMHAMVNRFLPDGSVVAPRERVTPDEALQAWTLGSAYADRLETRRGSLTQGKLADVTVLSDHPADVPPEEIDRIEVLATIIGGSVVHDTGLLTDGGSA